MPDRIRFPGGPSGSTSWAYWRETALVVEFYDHGAEAETTFGHDIAFLLSLDGGAQHRLMELLPDESGGPGDIASLPERLARRFTSYFEVRAWLDRQGIAYEHEFDSWA